MEENQNAEKKQSRKRQTGNKYGKRYTLAERLRAVKMHLEEGFAFPLVCQEMGMSDAVLRKWIKRYQERGQSGLEREHPPRGVGAAPEVVGRIVEMKKANPWWGVRRIALNVARWFHLPASISTVRKTLHEAELMKPRQEMRVPRNMVRPRHFERTHPNQMWQSDIFTFRLGGKYAYLIAFMDDYSRYIVGAELFRSASASNTLEVFRRAASEYNPPQEMLTDRGPQYANWRGKSRFEAEMQKNGIKHIKSRPQHPMTLGKVERFWASIWQEFLVRAGFESFESAVERIKLWIRYYNHKRPHQGIKGVCPADRYFEVAHELRQTIQKGIEENILELALRGTPRAPFYMVGRMEGQSVVLRAEKGKLRLMVDGIEQQQTKELVYDLKQKGKENGNDDSENSETPPEERDVELHLRGEVPGDPGRVDGTVPARGSVPGNGSAVGDVQPLAEPGIGGNDAGPGEQDQPLQRVGVESALAGVVAQAADWLRRAETRRAAGEDPGTQGRVTGEREESRLGKIKEPTDECGKPETGTGTGESPGDPASDGGSKICHGSGAGTPGVTTDVSRVDEAGNAGALGSAGRPGAGKAVPGRGSAEACAGSGEPQTQASVGGD